MLPDGSIGAAIQTGYREPRTLLTGVLWCGKPKPDGSICNVLMRTNTYYRSNTHLYTCLGKTQGGCGGVARNGPRADEYVTEAVLVKLEERQAVASDPVPWLGSSELERAQQKLGMLTLQWHEDRISADVRRRWSPPWKMAALTCLKNVHTSAKPFIPSSLALPARESAATVSSIPTSSSSYGVHDSQRRIWS